MNARTALAVKNIIGSFILKGGSILISFILVPLTLDYLNPYEYGIWLTLNSILSWIYIFDIGLGNGLRNKLTEVLATKDYEAGKVYVSTSFFCMSVIALLMLGILLLANDYIDWYRFMNVDPSKISNLGGIIAIVGSMVCLIFVLKLVGNIYMAYQLPSMNSFLAFIGNLISLLLIYILTKTTSGSLKDVAICFTASTAVVYMIAIPVTFRRYKEIAPAVRYIKLRYFKSLATLGVKFMIIQIAVLVIFMTTNIIISKLFGPEEVTPYNIAFKYFSIVTMVFSLILAPIWSAVTDAKAKGDYEWIRRTLKRMTKIWLLMLMVICGMLAFSGIFYHLWIGNDMVIPFHLSLWMAIYTAITTLSNLYSNIINGFGKLRLQLTYAAIQAIVYVPLAIFSGKHFGVVGILIALSFVCVFSTVINHLQCYKLINMTAVGFWNK